jgi:hydrogenase maturation protease
MAELLGKRPTLTVIGIEPEKVDWEMKLTPTLKKAFPEFLEVIRQGYHAYL